MDLGKQIQAQNDIKYFKNLFDIFGDIGVITFSASSLQVRNEIMKKIQKEIFKKQIYETPIYVTVFKI